MKRRRLLLLLGLFALGAAKGYSQQAGADGSKPFEMPSEPLLRPAPAFSQWVITFSYPEDQKQTDSGVPAGASKPVPESQAILPRNSVTTKTDQIIHEETVTVGGRKLENWQVKGAYYIKFPGKDIWSAYEKPDPTKKAIGSALVMTLPESGFRNLDWMNDANYAGKIKAGSGEWLVFVPGGRTALSLKDGAQQKALDSLPTLGYVDAETRLPVMVRTPNETREFKFTQPPPSSLQTLPDDLAAEIKEGDKIRAKRNAAPQREY